jgi:hypothetical protein
MAHGITESDRSFGQSVAWACHRRRESRHGRARTGVQQRGLYVDVDRSGHVQEPSEVTAAEVRVQLDRARRAVSAANALLDPSARNAHNGLA